LIAIINMGDVDGDPGGVRTYEIRINHEVIATFRHRRSDGLAVCLRQASDAVTRRHAEDLSAILNHINQEAP